MHGHEGGGGDGTSGGNIARSILPTIMTCGTHIFILYHHVIASSTSTHQMPHIHLKGLFVFLVALQKKKEIVSLAIFLLLSQCRGGNDLDIPNARIRASNNGIGV